MIEHYVSCHAVLSKFYKEWRESLLFDMLRVDRHSAAFTGRGRVRCSGKSGKDND
jgi:hypothetical protein